MASLKTTLLLLTALCGVSLGEAKVQCDTTVSVDYTDGVPTPSCSFACDDSSAAVYMSGNAYKRFPELQTYGKMVKIAFANGDVSSCTLVSYATTEEMQALAAADEAALSACTENSKGQVVPVITTAEPTTTTTTTPEPTTTTTTTPEPTTTTTTTTTTPEPTTTTTTTTTPEPTTTTTTTTTPEPTTTTTTTTPEPTTTTTTTTPEPTTTTTTTTTTTLPPITYSCPSGYTKYMDSKCYRYYGYRYSWNSAKSFCSRSGATLARMQSDAEYSFVGGFIGSNKIWIDINDKSKEGTYRFSNNQSATTKSKWFASGEPSGKSRWLSWWYRNQDCFSYQNGAGIYDEYCDEARPFVCETATTPSR